MKTHAERDDEESGFKELRAVELSDSMQEIRSKLKEFMENEARSCSMDFGCVTPIYIFRMFGGAVPLSEIEEALPIVQKQMMVGA